MQQLPVYQWEVCHYTEHRSKFAPFKKTDAANLLKSLTIIWLYRCKCIKKSVADEDAVSPLEKKVLILHE